MIIKYFYLLLLFFLRIPNSCNENQSKYVCPKCGAPYCSLVCYKSSIHLECTEKFYKDCIEEELDVQHSDDASKREMIDILKRVYGENEESGERSYSVFFVT